MVNGVRSSKSKIKIALLQPLTLLEMVVYHRKNKDMQRIKEVKLAHPFSSLPFNVVKTSIALLITEILYKTIKEEEENKELFNFLFNYIVYIDQTEDALGNIHLHFLLQLSYFLGFHPQMNFDLKTSPFFDLKEGVFTSHKPAAHPHCLELPLSKYLYQVMTCPLPQLSTIKLSKVERRTLLQALLIYYRLHVEGFQEVKSAKILWEVLG